MLPRRMGDQVMGTIIAAHAYVNNEVAYVAWDIDDKIDGCLGFEVVRVYLDEQGNVSKRLDGSEDRVTCAAWVAFKGQRNPHWLPQTTSLWPVQKLSWRDLTLRKRRNEMKRRPDEVRVRYEIRPLGDLKPGMQAAPDPTPQLVEINKRDKDGRPIKKNGTFEKIAVKAYEGPPRPLGYLGPAVASNPVHVTRKRGQFESTFTNGILAAQWLRNVLLEDGVKQPNELIDMISNPENGIRKYLAGDVIPMLREFINAPGRFLVALYELEDKELLDLLLANKDRLRIILANTGKVGDDWDVRNAHARKALIDAGVDIHHRMFNNSSQIGHNKFVVHIPPGGAERSVFTGSTNWTATGLAGQSNNALIIRNDEVAAAYVAYWERMLDDNATLEAPVEFDDGMPDNQQSKFPTLERGAVCYLDRQRRVGRSLVFSEHAKPQKGQGNAARSSRGLPADAPGRARRVVPRLLSRPVGQGLHRRRGNRYWPQGSEADRHRRRFKRPSHAQLCRRQGQRPRRSRR